MTYKIAPIGGGFLIEVYREGRFVLNRGFFDTESEAREHINGVGK